MRVVVVSLRILDDDGSILARQESHSRFLELGWQCGTPNQYLCRDMHTTPESGNPKPAEL